jgi:hypothetical protein
VSTPDWAFDTPNVPLHDLRGQQELTRPFTSQQLIEIGVELIEQFLRKVVEAVVGFFIPGGGSAFDQLADWAQFIPIVGDIVAAITGAFGDFTDLGSWFTDLIGILGNPLGLGSGSVTIGDLGDIPLLGGLFSLAGTILGALIPGLDASKIISGQFPMSMITGLLEALAETVQGLIDEFFGFPGQPVSAFTNFLKLLGGLFPALTPGGDGTASPTQLAEVVAANGAAIITGGVGTVLQVVDSTVTTLERALSGFLGIFGVHSGTMNAVVSGLQGSVADSATVNDVQIAAEQAAAALAANTSQILALQQGTDPGSLSVVDFTAAADASSLSGLGFNQTYGGPGPHWLHTEGGRALWSTAGTPYPDQTRWCVAVKNDVETSGDDQLIGVTYSSVPQEKTQDYIVGRANLAGDTYILVTFSSGAIRLYCVVGGTETQWKYKAWSKKSNTAYYLKCGPGRTYAVYENTNLILSHTEVGTTSAMGAGYRRGGFGGKANTKVFYYVPYFLRPGKVTSMSIADAA